MGLPEFLGRYGTSVQNLPSIAGEYRGNAVVCGDAGCIWDDLEHFGCRWGNSVYKPGWQFITVNRLIEVFPGTVEHAYSNVSRVINRHVADRRDEYAAEFGPPKHTHSRTVGTDWVWPWHGGGTSGFGAVLTALALGYDRIVLAGMPLTNMHHNGEPPWRRTRFTTEVEDKDHHWVHAIELVFEGRVRSLSGRTKEWLGGP
jgi:hypothetical protein